MSWRNELTARLAPLGLRPEREAEIIEELSQHLDDRVRDLVAAGAALDDARREALADLDVPGVLSDRLKAIESRGSLPVPLGPPSRVRWLGAVFQDTRYALASLRRSPGFACAVIATLALTIGPTTAMLSLGNWLIWRPPPGVVQPDRLAVVWFGDWRDSGSVSPRRISEMNLADIEDGAQTIGAIAGWQESTSSLAADGAAPRRVQSAHATIDFFEVLGIRIAAGRSFTADDDQAPFGSPVVIVSDGLARGIFGSPESALEQTLTINGRRMSIVGVLPPGFVGARPFSQVEVWFPSATYYYANHFSEAAMKSRQGRSSSGIFYTFVVRLAPGATFERLQAELDVRVPALADRYPEDNQAFRTTRARAFPKLGPDELMRDQYATLVRNLLVVGGVLLLLGCANVANLLISRGTRRQQERSVRVALGASSWRLVQLHLIESCALSLAGAGVGIGLAMWLKQWLQTLVPGLAGTGVDLTVPMDLRVLVTTLAVSLVSGLLAGVAPAWIGSSLRPGRQPGRSDLRTSTAAPRLRAGFAAVQLALSLALVTNAILLVVTLRHLSAVDIGFDARGVTTHFLNLNNHGYTADRAMVYTRGLLERLSADPMLESASLSAWTAPGGLGTWIQDPRGDEKIRIDITENHVSDGFFRTSGLLLVAGRTFTPTETMTTPTTPAGTPVVLSASLARRLYGEASAIGQRVTVPRSRTEPAYDLVVIGVVGDVGDALGSRREPQMYTPFAYGRTWVTRPVLLARSSRSLREVGAAVQSHATALDPTLPLAPPQFLTDMNERSLAGRRVFAWVLSLLGGLGFLLAAVGLYALLAQIVNERTREFGVRMAIGADRRHVFGLVLRQAAWIALAGSVIGTGLAFLGARVVEAQLVGVTKLDPRVYLVATLVLAAIVFAASLWPARSATRIQPVDALRAE